MTEIIIGVIFGTIIISLCFVRRHISDLLKMPCGNAGDGRPFSKRNLGRWSFFNPQTSTVNRTKERDMKVEQYISDEMGVPNFRGSYLWKLIERRK